LKPNSHPSTKAGQVQSIDFSKIFAARKRSSILSLTAAKARPFLFSPPNFHTIRDGTSAGADLVCEPITCWVMYDGCVPPQWAPPVLLFTIYEAGLAARRPS
jgi:hypothetical protein